MECFVSDISYMVSFETVSVFAISFETGASFQITPNLDAEVSLENLKLLFRLIQS